MTLDELSDFIEERDIIYHAWKGGATDHERILARTVKLIEEMGELADEILGALNYQRQAKLDKRDPDGLGDEFADVIITTMLLAKSMKVDIQEVLSRKMEKIRKRSMDDKEHSI